MSTNNNDYSHLKELGKSNYEVADGESDIRNWVVKNEKGNIFGEVEELIFDTTARKVVFLILDLDKNELNLKERKVLLPLEYAEIHEPYKNVIYKGLTPNEIAQLPTYEKGVFTRNSIDLTKSTFLSGMSKESSPQGQSDYQQQRDEVTERRQDQYTSERVYSEPQKPGDNLLRRDDLVEQERTRNVTSSALKPFTVIGVFEQIRQSQEVIDYLLNHGFPKDDITVSSRQAELSYERNNRDEGGITHFFKSLFNNDDDVKRYSDATERNYVVSVDVSSAGQAEEVANILDQHGSLNMNSGQNTVSSPADIKTTGNSRVFKRHANS